MQDEMREGDRYEKEEKGEKAISRAR